MPAAPADIIISHIMPAGVEVVNLEYYVYISIHSSGEIK